MALALILASGSLPSTGLAASSVSSFPSQPDSSTPLNLAQLDLASVTVPEEMGWVVETWQPVDQVPKALVVHVQDLHTHPEAQRHLSKLIGHLHEQLGIQLVALEGAEGLCDTTLYSDFPDPPSTKRLATLFLQEGMFTGAEHYAITHPGEVTLWGVEDEALYRQHLVTYQQGATRQAEVEAILKRLREHLIPLRQTLYPKALYRVLQLRDAYERDEDNSFQPYLTELQRLAKAAKLDLRTYRHLDAAAQAHKLWLRLDMNLVKEDTDRLLEGLWPRLRRSEQEHLTQLAEALTAKKSPTSRYYETLAEIAQAYGVRLQTPSSQAQSTTETLRILSAILLGTSPQPRPDYHALRQYLAYIQLSDQIRSGELAEELDVLDEAAEQAYFTTEQQRTLARLIKQVAILDDLLHVKLSPPRHRKYQQYKPALTAQALTTALNRVTRQAPVTPTDLQRLVEALPTQERFYELATRRDEAFVRNTLRKLEEHSTKAAILITGGFHTPGITTYLKQQGIAYLVVTPKVEGQLDESRYHAGLENALPPLADVLKKVDEAVLQIPLSSSQSSPPTTGKLPNGPIGRQDSQDYTFPTKRHAVFFYWLNAKIAALKRQFADWVDQLQSWIKTHPREATLYGIALTLVAGKVVLNSMGVEMQLDQNDGTLLAMTMLPGGPGDGKGSQGHGEEQPATSSPKETGRAAEDISTLHRALKRLSLIRIHPEFFFFSPDGRWLAVRRVAWMDDTSLFNLETVEDLSGSLGLGYRVKSVTFSPNSKWLVAMSSAPTEKEKQFRREPYPPRIFNLELKEKLIDIPIGPWAESVAFSPDGRWVVAHYPGIPAYERVFSLETRRDLTDLVGQDINRTTFSADGKRLIVSYSGRTVKVFDLEAQQELLLPIGGNVQNTTLSPDGRRLAVEYWDNSVKVFDLETKQDLGMLIGGNATVSTFSQDGQLLAVRYLDSDLLKIFDTETKGEVTAIPVPRGTYVWGVQFSSHKKWVLVSYSDSYRYPRKAFALKPQEDLAEPLPADATNPVFSGNGRWLMYSIGKTGFVNIIDLETRHSLTSLIGNNATRAMFSTDGKRLIAWYSDRIIRLFDLEANQKLTIPVSGGRKTIGFSPDGKRLAVEYGPDTVKVFDVDLFLRDPILRDVLERWPNEAYAMLDLIAQFIAKNVITSQHNLAKWHAAFQNAKGPLAETIGYIGLLAEHAFAGQEPAAIIDRYNYLYDNNITPVPYLLTSPLSVEEIRREIQQIQTGHFNVNNQIHVDLNYHVLREQMRTSPVQREITYGDFLKMLDDVKAGRSVDEIPEQYQQQLRGLVYEAYLLQQKIVALSERAKGFGKELVVVENLSLGAVTTSPITYEQAGRKFIVGTQIPVWSTKIGSTESHENEYVLRRDLFSPEQMQYLLDHQPIVIIVDASSSVSSPTRSGAHIPDSFKGYRNHFIAVNRILGLGSDPVQFGVNAAFIQAFYDTSDFQALIGSHGHVVQGKEPYTFHFYYPGEKPLLLRIGKQGDHPAPKLTDDSLIRGPAVIFAQTAIEPEAVPQTIRDQFINGVHAPGFFDDTDHFKKFFFEYKEGYGIVLSDKYVLAAREIYRELLRYLGKGPIPPAIGGVQGSGEPPSVGSTEGYVNEAILSAHSKLQAGTVTAREAAMEIVEALRTMSEPEHLVNIQTAIDILHQAQELAFAPIIVVLERYAASTDHASLTQDIQAALTASHAAPMQVKQVPSALSLLDMGTDAQWYQVLHEERRWQEGVNFEGLLAGRQVLLLGDTDHGWLGVQRGLVRHLDELKAFGVTHLCLEIPSDFSVADLDRVATGTWVPHRFKQIVKRALELNIQVVFVDLPRKQRDPSWTPEELSTNRGVYMGLFVAQYLTDVQKRDPNAKMAVVTGFGHVAAYDQIRQQLDTARIPYGCVALVSEGQRGWVMGVRHPFVSLSLVNAVSAITPVGQRYGFIDLVGLPLDVPGLEGAIHFERPELEAPGAHPLPLRLPEPQETQQIILSVKDIGLAPIREGQINRPLHLSFRDRVMPEARDWAVTNEEKILEFVGQLANLTPGQRLYLASLLLAYARNTGRHSLSGSILSIGFVPEGQFFEIVAVDRFGGQGWVPTHREISLETLQRQFGFQDLFVQDLSQLPTVPITNNPDRPLAALKMIPLVLAATSNHPERITLIKQWLYGDKTWLRVTYEDVRSVLHDEHATRRLTYLSSLEVEDFHLSDAESAFMQAREHIRVLDMALGRLQDSFGYGFSAFSPDKRTRSTWNKLREYHSDIPNIPWWQLWATVKGRMGRAAFNALAKTRSPSEKWIQRSFKSFFGLVEGHILGARAQLRYLDQEEMRKSLELLDQTIETVSIALPQVEAFLTRYPEWAEKTDLMSDYELEKFRELRTRIATEEGPVTKIELEQERETGEWRLKRAGEIMEEARNRYQQLVIIRAYIATLLGGEGGGFTSPPDVPPALPQGPATILSPDQPVPQAKLDNQTQPHSDDRSQNTPLDQASASHFDESAAVGHVPPLPSPKRLLERVIQNIRTQDELERKP